MTTRQKTGIGLVIGGVLALLVGGVFLGTEVTPEWVGFLVQGVGVIADLLGFKVVLPNTGDEK